MLLPSSMTCHVRAHQFHWKAAWWSVCTGVWMVGGANSEWKMIMGRNNDRLQTGWGRSLWHIQRTHTAIRKCRTRRLCSCEVQHTFAHCVCVYITQVWFICTASGLRSPFCCSACFHICINQIPDYIWYANGNQMLLSEVCVILIQMHFPDPEIKHSHIPHRVAECKGSAKKKKNKQKNPASCFLCLHKFFLLSLKCCAS